MSEVPGGWGVWKHSEGAAYLKKVRPLNGQWMNEHALTLIRLRTESADVAGIGMGLTVVVGHPIMHTLTHTHMHNLSEPPGLWGNIKYDYMSHHGPWHWGRRAG